MRGCVRRKGVRPRMSKVGRSGRKKVSGKRSVLTRVTVNRMGV
jgi:hypothetical protein